MHVSNALKWTGFASSMIPFESYSTTVSRNAKGSSVFCAVVALEDECITSAVVVEVGVEPC